MAIRSETITQESDLSVTWTDSKCPNMEWGFTEQTMEECLQEDGTYVATYETLEIPTGESFSMTYLCDSDGTTVKTYTIFAGEYGVKPA